ncbi:ammonium transporter [Rhabdothermincola sediminis]|uniref:ammonium transporter n=1 Tax=Rhabdothermincola sediminis TaxID=2751370 RepID=UPI001AA03C1B|nr:ammonium transporter [Rhabdothermincola sediminis]
MRRRLLAAAAVIATVLAISAAPALAQEGNEVVAEPLTADAVQVALDNIWVLIAAVLVIFMQAGFALVEAGLTRAKSVANIMMKNLMDFCVGVLAFAAVGFAIAFGTGNDLFGTSGWFLDSAEFTKNYLAESTLSLPTFFIFQVAFAATAATIVSGAMAERTKFKSYFVYSFLITALVYPVVVHWTWGGGWLANLDTPYIDFAGSSIVHMVGGIAALVGAAYLGPRIGKYGPDGKPRAIPGHSIPFAIIGVFILFIGWFGFNPGSQLAADGVVPAVAVTTLIAGAAGGVAAMAAIWLKTGKPDVAMTGNGVLAGLVGITAGTAHVNNWGAVAIGAIAGGIVVAAVLFFDRVRIDDPVGAVSVHGVCGAFGALAVGLFATTDGSPLGADSVDGLFYGGGASQLATQAIGVVAIAAFVAVTMVIVFGGIKLVLGLRVPEEEELAGLDVAEHGAPGYGPDVLGGSGIGDFSLVGVPVPAGK